MLEDIIERHELGQPILVGTVSIEKSELLSGKLNRRGVPHHVLNAKNHEKEAMIVAQAGRKGAVVVATNMAGRGVDILLGGNPEYLARQEMAARDWDNDRYLLFEMDEDERAAYEAEYEPILQKFQAQTDAEHEEVVELGGLYVLGTERHESRRIDNQLRGRSGRQGDPGESAFYLSLGDDLMRLFASDRVASIMDRLKWPDDEAITAKMVTRAVENAQKQIEELNYERRKNVLKYDDVMNSQREVIYGERRKILEGYDFGEQAREMVEQVVARTVRAVLHRPTSSRRSGTSTRCWSLSPRCIPVTTTKADARRRPRCRGDAGAVHQEALDAYEAKEEAVTAPMMRDLERIVLAEHHGHEVARAPLRDGLPPGRHPSAVLRPEGSADGVPARGVRHVLRADGVDPRGLRALHLPRGVRASRSRSRPGLSASQTTVRRSRAVATRRRPAVRQPATRSSATRCRGTLRAHAVRARSTRSATAPRSRPRLKSVPGPADPLLRCRSMSEHTERLAKISERVSAAKEFL